MVYEWDGHRDECYRLYITERRSLEDIMQHMRDAHNFAPSKRAFQTQFKRWGFPSKQNPAHRNVSLVARVKELWEQNYSQRDMLRTLNEEGFQIKERELMRVRAKNRWLLRIPNGQKATPEETAFQAELIAAAALPNDDEDDEVSALTMAAVDVPDAVVRKRKERHEQLQQESDERWASKKRRRRTREYAGLPADPPGPPRFPSETTLGESMEYLSLDNNLYKEVRNHFQEICESEKIIKKTLAGQDKWQAVKDRLVQENEHLRDQFAEERGRQAKALALDVICTDVTKRMRTVETRMTIVDAKNALGINPEQSRQIRSTFYVILQNDHFTSKLETGPEHWAELKEQWIEQTPLLKTLLVDGEADPQHDRKRKALEVLCRDVMKRLRDAQKRGKPISSSLMFHDDPIDSSTAPELPHPGSFELGDLQIDPMLLPGQDDFMQQQPPPPPQPPPPQQPPVSQPVPVWIKPAPQSQLYVNAKMRLETLTSREYVELERIIKWKWTEGRVTRIDGILKTSPDAPEIPIQIENDDELYGYLENVQGSKAVFMVQVDRI